MEVFGSQIQTVDDDDGGVATRVVPTTEEDRLGMMLEGINSTESTFSYRLVGHFFLKSGDYENTVDIVRKGLTYVARERANIGLPFRNTEDALTLCLATSLIYFQSPRHHQEAKKLFDKVFLFHSCSNTKSCFQVLRLL